MIRSQVICENICNDGECNPQAGQCEGSSLPDGTSCNDGDPCTDNQTCVGGVCLIERQLCQCDEREAGQECDDENPAPVLSV